MFCNFCGKENPDNVAFCNNCGQPLQDQGQPQQPPQPQQGYYQQPQQGYYQPAPKKSYASMILGIISIVSAWLLAIIGHVTAIIGIILGVQEYKRTKSNVGLILSIIGAVCSVISSLLGILIVNSYLYF